MPSFSVDGAINSLELTARVTVNDVKINISFKVDGEKDRVDARHLYALWLRFGARRSGRVKSATTLLVKSAPQRLGAAIHAIPSCKPVPDGLSMLEFRLQTFLTRSEMVKPLAQGDPPSVVTQQMAQRQNHPTQTQTQR